MMVFLQHDYAGPVHVFLLILASNPRCLNHYNGLRYMMECHGLAWLPNHSIELTKIGSQLFKTVY
jgi:hypothetical protein